MSTNDLTDRRKWLGATLAAALTGVVWLAAQGPQEGNGLTFTTVSDPTLFPQTLMATTGNIADPQYGILGGIAFAPDGDVWSAECVFSGTRLHRFDMQQWVAVDANASPVTYVHPEIATLDYGPFYVPGIDPEPTGKGGCGLVNHPDGYMYSNSAAGIWRFDPATGLPVPLPGQSQATAGLVNTRPGSGLGIAVDPKADAGYHAVYVGSDCHYQTNVGEDTCTIYDFNPAEPDPLEATKVFARVHTSMVEMIDGLYFDPSGNYLFGAQRGPFNALLIFARPQAPKPLDAPADDSQIVRQVPMASEPDGVAFHVADQNNGPFVVTLNESYDGDLAGTMTRFDFPNNGDYTTEPTQSTFASGGFRGDLLTVGGDGCIYGTQGLLYSVGGLYGTRFNDGTASANNSVFKMCGGFAPPPGVSPNAGSLSGYAYVDVNRDGTKQAGEPGIPGVTITVANGGTQVTDSNGHYSFGNLQADTYSVSAPDPAANKHLFTASPIDAIVAVGADTPNVNFGYVPGQISGFAFVDTNRDQVRQLNETGIGGVTITLNNGGTPVSVTTASDGGYSFPDLDANNYNVSAPSTAAGKVIDTAPAIPIGLQPGENRPDVNFGYVPGGLSGFAYVDANRNGVKDAGEAGIPNVTITGPNGETKTTGADGSYSFDNLDGGLYSVSAPATAAGKMLFTLNSLSITLAAGAFSPDNDFGYVPGGLSGVAYIDANRNSARDAGEAGIGGVVITGPGGTATTAADGSYSFSNLDAATYAVSAPSTANGKALFSASPLNVVVTAGETSPNNDFGYVTGGLSGFAYVDANRSGVMDAGEAGLGGVVITGPAGATTTTAADGSYAFSNLDAGAYSVSAPATASGKALSTGSPLSVTIAAGATSANHNFGYVTGGLSGFAYVDANRNSVKDAGEAGLGGVVITGPSGTTTTAADGSYSFSDLDAGTYSVSAPSAASGKALFTASPLSVDLAAGATSANNNFGYVTGGLSGFAYVDANRNSVKDAGEAGLGGVVITGPSGTTTTAADGSYSFSGLDAGTHSVSAPATASAKALFTPSPLSVTIAAGATSANHNFGYVTGGLSGFAYVDTNRNSVKDAGEAGLGGVVITGPSGTTTTAADGSYSFSDLDAGTYSVSAPSAASGKALFTASPLSVDLAAGASSANNNFGYVTGGLSGFAYVDANRNSAKDAGEAGIANVTITGPSGATTITAADGSYSFSNLDGGTYSVSAPSTASGKALFTASPLSVDLAAGATSANHNFGYVTGGLSGFAYVDANRNSAKDAGEAGIANVTITGPSGTTTTAADGSYSFSGLDAGTHSVSAPATASAKALFTASPLNVDLAPGATSANNDFGYVTGGLSGFAYVDVNRNSVKDAGEAGLGGVVIAGPSGTTTTAADGSYSFSNLDGGTYSVSAPATASGKALFTPSPLSVDLAAGATSANHNFGYVTGGLSGFAYVDANRNSVMDAGEAGLGGVVIAGPSGTTTTAADGSYSFSNLDGGSYSVSAPSTASGKALFTTSPLGVDLAAGATSANHNFGYVTGGLSGFAYVDANRNGVKDAGEAGISGVVIAGPSGTTTTAADGSYSFSSLDGGTYSVSAPSTASGKALFTASPLSVDLAAGATSANHNFGYVTGGLSGFAYVDANRNSAKDAGEAGIANVTITGPSGATTITAADGSYSFSNLDSGTYSLSAPSTASGKALFTASPLSVDLAAGATSANHNFGYVTGGLSGFAYVDANRNGVKDAGEAGISGVVIAGPSGTTTTAADGGYSFSGLDGGTYSVSAPSTASGKALFTASPLSVDLAAGATSANHDFGYVTGGLSGFAYVDANRNGVKDAGEAGISGVVISGPGGTVPTAADGSYSFSSLDGGTYSVSAPSTASGKALFTASPLSVDLAAGATSANHNFGYVTGGLSGFAYVDANRNSVKDAGEAGISGVVITGPSGTTTTAADGSYAFNGLDAGAHSVSAPSAASGKALFTPSPLTVTIAAGATSANNNFGYVTGGLSGFAYVDANRNSVKDAGEAGLGGVVITGPSGTATTAADGSYSFSSLDGGTYSVSAPSTASGKALFTASPLSVTIAAGATSANNNFGYVTGGLSGFAYVDANRNSVKDAGEAGLGGVVITGPSGTATTAADGSYSFSNLDGGTYSVSAPSTASGKALFTPSPLSVTIAAGATSANNNFGYVTGGLSGFAYVDANRNSVKDAGEAGLGGVVITGPSGTTTTAADGSYSFSNLDGGTYSVSAPSTASGKALFTASPLSVDLAAGATSANNNFGYVTGGLSGFAYVDANRNSVKDAGEAGLGGVVITGPGGTATTAADGSYSFSSLDGGTYSVSAPSTASGKALFTPSPLSVTIAAGATSSNNNFGYVTGGLSGFAYVDANRNSVKDAGEAGLGGVVITGPSGTTTTAADGSYSFSNLNAGTYSVSAPSSASGKALFTPSPLSVTIAAGASSANNNFGYVTGGLSGFAYVDANRNSIKDAGEAVIAGVVITGPGGTRTTAADGSYSFTTLDAGTYSVSAPSTASGKGLFTPSPLSVTIAAGATSANNNFGYVSGLISGFAYVDANRNSVMDAGEAGLGGVVITGPSGATTTTAGDGSYSFNNLNAGTYSVSAPSTASGKARFTASPLSVTIAAGGTSANNNFGYVTGTISGFTYVDANKNGVRDSGEAGLGGVTLTLAGAASATTTSAADGSYAFTGLNSGSYSVSAPATAAGLARFTTSPLNITLAAGATSANNNFGYITGSISGYTYVDANRNGVKDSGEAIVSGVPVTLAGGATVNSDANGFYSFTGLSAATYSDSAAATTASGLTLITPSPLSVVVAAGQTVTNVNFGYLDVVTSGDTGSTGYWKNQNGQALIKAVNGGPNATAFATWLASNFSYLYGANSGSYNLTGKKNTDVAALFVTLFNNNKPESQVMAVAIAMYVTSSTLSGGNYAAAYGFTVTPAGVAGAYYNVGSYGTAIGLSNNTYYTLMQIVQQANLRKQQGLFDTGAFSAVCGAINLAGHIV